MPLRNFKLTLDAKRHIVCALARGVRHDDIVEQVIEQFDISIYKRALRHYQPSQNPRLDDELKTLYEQEHGAHWQEMNRRVDEIIARRRQQPEIDPEAQRAKMKQAILDKLRKS